MYLLGLRGLVVLNDWVQCVKEQPSIVMHFYLSHDAVHIQAGKEAAGKFCRPCCLPKTQRCICKILHRMFSGFYTSCFLEGHFWKTMLIREVAFTSYGKWDQYYSRVKQMKALYLQILSNVSIFFIFWIRWIWFHMPVLFMYYLNFYFFLEVFEISIICQENQNNFKHEMIRNECINIYFW